MDDKFDFDGPASFATSSVAAFEFIAKLETAREIKDGEEMASLVFDA